MPIAWIEKNVSPRVKDWAYDYYVRRDVLWATDRQRQGYPVVAEIPISDEDVERFDELKKAVTVLMFHRDLKPIDDENVVYPIDDIVFHLECCD